MAQLIQTLKESYEDILVGISKFDFNTQHKNFFC